MSNENPVELVKSIQASMDKMKVENENLLNEIKNTASASHTDAKAAVKMCEELASKIQAGATTIVELEQKLAHNVHTGKAPIETLGRIVIKSDAFKQFANGNTNKMRIEANTITGQEGSPPENSDTLVAPQRLGGIVGGAFRSLKLLDVLPQGSTNSNAVEYAKENVFTNNAAETAEGDTKPQSSITFTLATANIRTIAHWLKVSKQVVEDAPALQSYIDTRLRYGTDVKYDYQLLRGNGTNQNISGIMDSGNFTAFTPTNGENQLDSINRGIEAVAVADYQATAIILHPTDWHAIERLKVDASDDRYIIGNPNGIMGASLWGKPVVVTNQMRVGYFVVGAMDMAYQVWNRSGTVVEMFEQDDTNVQKNLLTIRSERRGTLATYRAASVYSGLLVFGSSS
jgi:HK97 family phage major capsid protein